MALLPSTLPSTGTRAQVAQSFFQVAATGNGNGGNRTGKVNTTSITATIQAVQSQVAQSMNGTALNVTVVLADLGLSSSARLLHRLASLRRRV